MNTRFINRQLITILERNITNFNMPIDRIIGGYIIYASITKIHVMIGHVKSIDRL